MKILMTAFRHDVDSVTNWMNLDNFVAAVQSMGITPQPVKGFWKGESEPSYMIHGVTQQNLQQFVGLAKQYNQDAILLVGDDGRSHLLDTASPDVQWHDVGDWHQVAREIAIQFDAYTVTRDGRHYVAATRREIADKQRRLLATQASVIAANEYRARTAAVGF